MSSARKSVILVNISTPDCSTSFFEEMYQEMLQMLGRSFRITMVTTLSELQDQLLHSNSKVLIFVNDAVAKKKNKEIQSLVLPYIEKGGMVILGGLFSSFTRPNDMSKLFANLGLPWKNGAYHRTTHQITSIGKSLLGPNVENSYSVKALQLTGVESGDRLYAVAENARTQSFVFSAELADPDNVMAAMKRIGSGAIVYLGDVNAETGTSKIVVALCSVDL